MKRLGISQRVAVIDSYQERRDCLDQRWYEVAAVLGFIPVPLPNVGAGHIENLLVNTPVDALLLSGGNSVNVSPNDAPDAAPERDLLESHLIDFAMINDIPLLGVCRGMQMINIHLGGGLRPVSGHIACRHALHAEANISPALPAEVNSFHGWGIAPDDLSDALISLASDVEGHIEAFRHRIKRVAGIMWHPERENPLREADIQLLMSFLK